MGDMERETVCAESGWYAGVDASVDGDAGAYDTGETYILDQYGEITCEGVIADWSFHKSIECDNIKLQVFEDLGSGQFRLVGQNLYDSAVKNCNQPAAKEQVTVYIPAHEQIPVKPRYVIGWTHMKVPSTARSMIRYNDNTGSARHYKNCDNVDMGDVISSTAPTPACTFDSTVNKLFRLQAHVIQGKPPDIANLPYTVEVRENVNQFAVYSVQASHEKNNIDQGIAWWNPVPVPLTFSLVTTPINGTFNVDQQQLPNMPVYTGKITNNFQLDFEYVQEHNVTVTVEGQGLTTSSYLTVRVIDMNEEHKIEYLPQSINVSVKGVAVGDQIYQVVVSDPDTINPSVIEYFISSSNERDPAPPFTIDRYSGTVRISKEVTHWYEPTQYILTITATDYMYSVYGTLTVNLIDTKTNPVFLNLPETIQLPEDAPNGSEIFQVLVDGTPENQFLYKITTVAPFEMTTKFGIHQDGWIYLTNEGDLDYVYYPTIIMEVFVGDGAFLNSSSILTISLTWVNQGPVFSPRFYRVTIPERCDEPVTPANCGNRLPWPIPGLSIGWTHRDDALPEPVSCSILPSHGSTKFALSNTCRQLILKEDIDVNTDPQLMSINLTLTLEDTGPPPLGDTALVFVSVYDINDNNPQFYPALYATTIDENTPGGVSLFPVTATDIDFGRNGEFYYNISSQPASFYFQVHPLTGVVSTKHPVEYDGPNGIKAFNFQLTATDRGTPNVRSSSATVNITVNDVNDNKPRFDCWYAHRYPKGVDPHDPDYECFYNLDVRYDILINHKLMTFFATDVDSITPKPEFHILNVEPHFRMENANSIGYLFTEDKLYNYHTYGIIVEANDMGTPQLKARPPSVVRVDTFDGPEHLVDITLGNMSITFNKTIIQTEFIQIMRSYCAPWIIRLYAFSEQRDRTIVTVYGLEDASTFLHSNFDQEKYFIPLSDLLQKLRSSAKGTPRPDFEDIASEYIPLEVQPTYPKFLIHTLGGWITLLFLFLLLLILIIVLIVCLCRCFAVCCFRKRLPTEHAWMHDKPLTDENYYYTVNGTTVKRRTTAQSKKTTPDTGDNNGGDKSGSDSASTGRRPSVDTVHSLIYDTKK